MTTNRRGPTGQGRNTVSGSMTTNEQAEARRALADIIEHAQHPNHVSEVGPDALDQWWVADAILNSEWLAGERHRVAEQCAQTAFAGVLSVIDKTEPALIGDTVRLIIDRLAQETREAILAAFPAVGGSTPAVDGEGDAKGRWPCRAECPGGHSHPLTTCESEPPPAVSDNLPLDPKPWVSWGVRYAECPSPAAYLNPRIDLGYSGDKSRYREGAGT